MKPESQKFQKFQKYKEEDEKLCRLNRRWQLWINSQKICGLCNEEIHHFQDSSIDHIMPRSRGGSDGHSNIQITHKDCNNFKGDLLPWQEKLLRFLRDWLLKSLFKVRHGVLNKHPGLKKSNSQEQEGHGEVKGPGE